MAAADQTFEGGCDCRRVRYRMESAPLFVHCCHCRWCQRETGASFALNALIEADRVTLLAGEPLIVDSPDQIPLPEGHAMWVHPVGGKLHVHRDDQIAETVLLR